MNGGEGFSPGTAQIRKSFDILSLNLLKEYKPQVSFTFVRIYWNVHVTFLFESASMLLTVLFFMLDNLAFLELFTLDNVHSLSFSLFRLLRLTSNSGLHFFEGMVLCCSGTRAVWTHNIWESIFCSVYSERT